MSFDPYATIRGKFAARSNERGRRSDGGGQSFVRTRLAIETIAVQVQNQIGASEIAFWRAEVGTGRSTEVNRWEGQEMDSRLYLSDRSFQVLGELTGRARPSAGEREASIDEKRDALYELVRVVAHNAETPATDAPEHRKPHISEDDERLAWPERGQNAWNAAASIEQHLFAHQVTALWTKENFGKVVNQLRDDGRYSGLRLDNKTVKDLLKRAPVEPHSRHATERVLAEGRITDKEARQWLAPPKQMEFTKDDLAVRGFLNDLAARARVSEEKFLNDVQAAPPAQKSWQIAGELMAGSEVLGPVPVRDTGYYAARERLSEAIDKTLPVLTSSKPTPAAEVREEATARVMRALRAMEREFTAGPWAGEFEAARVATQVEALESAPNAPSPRGNGHADRGGFGVAATHQQQLAEEMTPEKAAAGQPSPGTGRASLTPEQLGKFAETWRTTARRTQGAGRHDSAAQTPGA